MSSKLFKIRRINSKNTLSSTNNAQSCISNGVKFSDFVSGDELKVSDQVVGLRSSTDTRFDFPGTGIKDQDGNYLFRYFSAGVGSSNYLQFNNSISGDPVIISSAGSDPDVSITIQTQGLGDVHIPANVDQVTRLDVDNLRLDGNTFSSTNTNGNIDITPNGSGKIVLDGLNWPTSDGPVDAFLFTDGAGNLGFTTVSFPITVGPIGTILRSNGVAWVASTSTFSDTYPLNSILYASSVNAVSSIPTANNAVLITDGGGIPSLSTTLPTTVQLNITSLGTVTTGTWNATIIDLAHGGTNANLTASNGGIFYSTASAGAILAGTATADQVLLSGASGAPSWSTATYPVTTTINQLLYSSNNNVISELTTLNNGVLVTSGGGIPSISNTLPIQVQLNITELGTITTGVWNGTIIDLVHGGTNANLVASNGGLFYSTATGGAILSGTATANQIPLSGSNSAPSWSTATYPSTTTSNQLLYSPINNTISGLSTQNSAVLLTNPTGTPLFSASLTNGQLIIGDTGNTPVVSTLTAGSGISIFNAPGSITINSSGGGYSWVVVSTTSQAISITHGYIVDNSSLVTLTLPVTSNVGDTFAVQGKGTGLFQIAQNAGQSMHLGSSTTSIGIGGSIRSTNRYDSIVFVCIVANTEWASLSGPQGIFTYT